MAIEDMDNTFNGMENTLSELEKTIDKLADAGKTGRVKADYDTLELSGYSCKKREMDLEALTLGLTREEKIEVLERLFKTRNISRKKMEEILTLLTENLRE